MGTRPQLSGPIHAEPVDELAELREELSDLRGRFDALETSYQSDRDKLGSLLHALRAVLGGNGDGAPASSQSASMPPSREAWNAWKQQLPDSCGKVIDALLVQPLTRTQMKAICKLAYNTVTAAVRILERNGLVEADGDFIRLKRL